MHNHEKRYNCCLVSFQGKTGKLTSPACSLRLGVARRSACAGSGRKLQRSAECGLFHCGPTTHPTPPARTSLVGIAAGECERLSPLRRAGWAGHDPLGPHRALSRHRRPDGARQSVWVPPTGDAEVVIRAALARRRRYNARSDRSV